MKCYCYILLLSLCFIQQALQAQFNNYFLPPVLNGPVYNLTMQNGTHQFNPGITSDTKGFNGSILGPTLIMQAGQQVEMNVTNRIGEETTVHWHGLHVAPENDGGPHTIIDPNTTWSPAFRVLDKAATYWYHPHAHELTAKHLSQGLAGLIIVKDAEEAALTLPRTYGVDDFPLIIQTKAISDAGLILYSGHAANLDDQLMVNGVKNSQLTVPRQMVRFRILNGSSQRVFNLGLTKNYFDYFEFYHIATDGGLKNRTDTIYKLRLAPGERAEIVVNFGSFPIGTNLELYSDAYSLEPGTWGGKYPWVNGGPPSYDPNYMNGENFTVLRFLVTGSTANPVFTAPPANLGSYTPIPEAQANTTREKWLFSGGGRSGDGSGVTIGSNSSYSSSTPFSMSIVNDSIPFNNTEIWTLHGANDQYHPFHIHDVQFYILDRKDADGKNIRLQSHELGRKDVVHVGPRETVRIIAKFDDFHGDVPYMYHCHIPIHEDKGMMKQFIVRSQELYVDKNYTSPIQTGSNSFPFNTLRIAVNNAYYSATIKFLSAGTHEEISNTPLLIQKRITLKPTSGSVIIQ